MAAPFGFPDYHLVDSPTDGFWRVTSWRNPFEPKDPAPPVGEIDAAEDEAGRFDDPDGIHRTLYCSSEAEGALCDKIAAFLLNPRVARRIEAFLVEEPDPEFADEDLTPTLDEDMIDGFNWQLAWAPSAKGARFVDLWHWSTCAALLPHVGELLANFALKALDVRALADERRGFTRRLAGIVRRGATGDDGQLRSAGIRYTSRLPPRWTCWALWEPLALDTAQMTTTRVTIDTPELRRAANKLGVVLAGPQETSHQESP